MSLCSIQYCHSVIVQLKNIHRWCTYFYLVFCCQVDSVFFHTHFKQLFDVFCHIFICCSKTASFQAVKLFVFSEIFWAGTGEIRRLYVGLCILQSKTISVLYLIYKRISFVVEFLYSYQCCGVFLDCRLRQNDCVIS